MRKILTCSILGLVLAMPLHAQKAALPEGYGEMKWATPLEEALKTIKGKLTFTDNRKVILSREGDIEYRYGFFYREPESAEPAASTASAAPAAPAATAPDKTAENRPLLFYVSVGFPYMTLDSVLALMKERYGEPTGENMKDNRGALVWDSEKTTIVLWVDSYEKKPFCRRITYLSKDISVQVTDYQNKIFNKREIEILKTLGK